MSMGVFEKIIDGIGKVLGFFELRVVVGAIENVKSSMENGVGHGFGIVGDFVIEFAPENVSGGFYL